MNISLRLAKLEAATKPQRRNLITFGFAGYTDDEIIGATIGKLTYQRNTGETYAEFEQRIDDCPHRPDVAIAMMTYAEVPL